MNKENIIKISVFVIILLLIPFFAMQFTNEVNWDISDFLLMGILLFCSIFLTQFTLRIATQTKHKIAIVIILTLIFMLIWAELAVGIFGTFLAGN